MSVIQINIDESLINSVGTKAMKTFIEQQIDILRLQYQGEHIARTINVMGIDHDKEVSEAG